ncbi:hypothetical protein [Paenibacillus sp. y28]|uniref:hypothetical protein n=1 Tax=Paenibacillus sp. y28 TaxID=3129110 RepID=UPI003015E2C5
MNRDLERLMMEASKLPDGEARLGVLEEAARLADITNHAELGYEACSEMVELACKQGFPMKAITAFSRLLGQYDKQPELYDSDELLWRYKWIVGKLLCFPEISREQVEGLLEDLHRRCVKQGYSARTYYYYRFGMAVLYKDKEEAGRCLPLFRSLDTDKMSDCTACEQNTLVLYYAMLEDDVGLLKAADPILTGRMSCAEVPNLTLSKVLLPLYRLGQAGKAQHYHRQGYPLVMNNRYYLSNVSEHMGFLALTSPLKGVELFERHLPQTFDHEDPLDNLRFHLYAALLMKKLAEKQIQRQLRLPAAFAGKEDAADVEKLGKRFARLAQAAADQFDRRNGNPYYSTLVQSTLTY